MVRFFAVVAGFTKGRVTPWFLTCSAFCAFFSFIVDAGKNFAISGCSISILTEGFRSVCSRIVTSVHAAE